MKGYCVDVRGFNIEKKRLVVEAIVALTGCRGWLRLWDGQKRLGNVSRNGEILRSVAWGGGKVSKEQTPHSISFNDLMLEAGYNYVEDGVDGFKAKSPNKTRPLITREQYDAVMAQSDKRSFTKALDDLLAIEKDQLLDESAIRIKQLERENQELVEARFADRIIVDPLRRENKRLKRKLEESKRGWIVSCLISISAIAVMAAYDFLK